MKIEFYHSCLDIYGSASFKECVFRQIPHLISEKYKKKVYKIQFYTDFYFKEKGYLFIDDNYCYYPLTVIFPNRKWEVCWIRWKKHKPVERFGKLYFYPGLLPKEGVDFELCDEVPTEFEKYINGKNLYGVQPNNLPTAVIKYLGHGDEIGVFSTAFADTLRTQVYNHLLKLTGKELTSCWEFYVTPFRPSVKVNGVSYLTVGILNRFAECLYIGACWSEDVNTCDFITTNDVEFQLTDNVPGFYTDGIVKTVEFIKETTVGKKSRDDFVSDTPSPNE